MRIKRILSQYRRDFRAVFECEHCGHQLKRSGYDDAFFHNKVVPNLKCPSCGKKATEDYRPLTTKYPDGYQI